jgi:uncharacterized protein (DUF58 family)
VRGLEGLAPARTPERPGPGPLPDALLRALDLTIGRRVEGMLSGDYRSTQLGFGSELAQVRPYEPGDDVRLIDWNVTARTRVPHVRVHLAERVMTTWLVLDTSASMQFGTADRRKADVAEGVVLTVSHLATRRAGRIGLVLFDGGRMELIPPRGGRLAVLGTLRHLHAGRELPHRAGSLADALKLSLPVMRTRAAVFVVTDLIGPDDWRRPLINLAGRHDVTVVEVRDPREDRLVDVGDLWFADPESGAQVRVDTSDPRLRRRFAESAAAERAEVRRILRATGARHVVLSTEGDWLRAFATFVRRDRSRG